MTSGQADSYAAPLFSIIIPTFNEAPTIHFFLQQLQALRSADCCEIIIVDGGSSDNTVSLATPFVDQVIAAEAGRACQMNAGASVAAGRWLLFLHADTFFPATIKTELLQLSESTYKWGFFPVRLSGEHFLFRVIERAISWRSRLSKVATGDQAIVVEKDLFKEAGGYADLLLMEDIALTKHLRQHASPWVFDQPVITSSRRWEKNGIVKTIFLMWLLRAAYFFGASPRVLARIYYGR
jgi:rSAM/selenodomain-associated transferase 2